MATWTTASGPGTAAARAVLLIATLVALALAETIKTDLWYFDLETCLNGGPPIQVQSRVVASYDPYYQPCPSDEATCYLYNTAGSVNFYVTTICSEEAEISLPEFPGASYLAKTYSDKTCTMPYYLVLMWRIGDGCQPSEVNAGLKYHQVTIDGDSVELRWICSDSSCTSCMYVEGGDLGMCDGHLGQGLQYLVLEASPTCAAPAYTVPLGDFEAQPLQAASERRDCFAAVDTSVLGGWAVTADAASYCCTERGTLVESTSATGCAGTNVRPSSFFYDDATQTTYQECYSGLEAATCLPTPGEDDDPAVLTAVAGGALVSAGPEGELARSFAITIDGAAAGAYALMVGGSVHYCTGRGTVVGATCRMNRCDDSTLNFITVGAAASEGDFCYHTCFLTE